MTTATTAEPATELQKTDLQNFLAIKSEISKFAEQYGSLTIAGIDDRLGIERVHAARMMVKKKRIQVEKRGKELRDEAIKTQKNVLAAERDLVGLLEPVETHLKNEEDRIADLNEEIRREEARKIEAKIQGRVAQMVKIGLTPNLITVRDASDQDFADYMETQTKLHQEKLKKEQEEKDQRAKDLAKLKKDQDDIRLEKERLDGIRKRQEAEDNRLAAEKRRLEVAERERLAKLAKSVSVAAAPPSKLIPIEPNAPSSPAVSPVASSPPHAIADTVDTWTPFRNSLLVYADKVKKTQPPNCPDDLRRRIQGILLKCGTEIEEAVLKYR